MLAHEAVELFKNLLKQVQMTGADHDKANEAVAVLSEAHPAPEAPAAPAEPAPADGNEAQ